MKISEQPVNVALGVREASERKRLAAEAKARTEQDRHNRATEFEMMTGRSDHEWALECVDDLSADPRRFIANLPSDAPPPRKKKTPQTPGMVHTTLESMALHALSIESLSRILPEAERTAHRDAIYHAVEALELLGRPHVD